MSQQGTVGTRAQQADLEEQIPASELRGFMEATNRKLDALIQASNDREKQFGSILDELGKIRLHLNGNVPSPTSETMDSGSTPFPDA